jgi:hypothetical protein
MPDSGPKWLAFVGGLDKTKWAPGDGPNPTIQSWLRFVATSYPNMAAYCNSVINEDYFSWCGLTVGYCMAKAGIAPVFGDIDTSRFLFATACPISDKDNLAAATPDPRRSMRVSVARAILYESSTTHTARTMDQDYLRAPKSPRGGSI